MSIREFFNVDKPAPEKIHLEIDDKDEKDRRDIYDTILRAVHAAFHRLFGTKELYKIVVDIRLEKRQVTKKVTVNEEENKNDEAEKTETKSDISNVENTASNSGGNKYHNGYSNSKKES